MCTSMVQGFIECLRLVLIGFFHETLLAPISPLRRFLTQQHALRRKLSFCVKSGMNPQYQKRIQRKTDSLYYVSVSKKSDPLLRRAHHLWSLDLDEDGNPRILRAREEADFATRALLGNTPAQAPEEKVAKTAALGTGYTAAKKLTASERNAQHVEKLREIGNKPALARIAAQSDLLPALMLAIGDRAPNKWAKFTRSMTATDWNFAVDAAREIGVQAAANAVLELQVKKALLVRTAQSGSSTETPVLVIRIEDSGMAKVKEPAVASEAAEDKPFKLFDVPLDALQPFLDLLPLGQPEGSEMSADMSAEMPGGDCDCADSGSDDEMVMLDSAEDSAEDNAEDSLEGNTEAPAEGDEAVEGEAPEAPAEVNEGVLDLHNDMVKLLQQALDQAQGVRRKMAQGLDPVADTNMSGVVRVTKPFTPRMMEQTNVRIPAGAVLSIDGGNTPHALANGMYMPADHAKTVSNPPAWIIRLAPMDPRLAGRDIVPGYPFVLISPDEFTKNFERVDGKRPASGTPKSSPDVDANTKDPADGNRGMPGDAIPPGELDPKHFAPGVGAGRFETPPARPKTQQGAGGEKQTGIARPRDIDFANEDTQVPEDTVVPPTPRRPSNRV